MLFIHRTANIPLFSSDTAPFNDINRPEPSSSRARSPLFSATESSRSHLMVGGYPLPNYPPPTSSNPDGSTLTSGYSIDRPMFSDSTTMTSGESGPFAPFGHTGESIPQGQQISLKDFSEKTRSSESDGTTYV